MRRRKKKNIAGRLAACYEYILDVFEEKEIDVSYIFSSNNPVYLEIGSGKGKFITNLAENNENINFVAVEKYLNVAVTALERIKEKELQNIKFITKDAINLAEIFKPKSFDRIYINFCDPWPKNYHTPRRLTSRGFLDIYKIILKEKGQIFFKTDNVSLFDFSVKTMQEYGFKLSNVTYDLHKNGCADENGTTEYEQNFINKGIPICFLQAEFL